MRKLAHADPGLHLKTRCAVKGKAKELAVGVVSHGRAMEWCKDAGGEAVSPAKSWLIVQVSSRRREKARCFRLQVLAPFNPYSRALKVGVCELFPQVVEAIVETLVTRGDNAFSPTVDHDGRLVRNPRAAQT